MTRTARTARTARPRATRAALLLAAATMLALPTTALAAGDGLTSTGSADDQKWVCIGEPGKRPYCVFVTVPGG